MARMKIWALVGLLVAVPAALVCAALVRPAIGIDKQHMKLSFEDSFGPAVSFYDPLLKQGRWKTNYWFGWQEGASSRTFASEQEIMVDKAFAGIDPFVQGDHGIAIDVDRTPLPNSVLLGGKAYTGGILTTETSFSQLYGYFEARITMPANAGFWPAFWLWSQQGAKSLGNEIDIVEAQTSVNDKTWHSLHLRAKPSNDGNPIKLPEVVDTTAVETDNIARPHVYGLLWTPQKISWYIDGAQVLERKNLGFHDPMFLILTNGVGGWEPSNDHPIHFPGRMQIDYVRAYQLPNLE